MPEKLSSRGVRMNISIETSGLNCDDLLSQHMLLSHFLPMFEIALFCEFNKLNGFVSCMILFLLLKIREELVNQGPYALTNVCFC